MPGKSGLGMYMLIIVAVFIIAGPTLFGFISQNETKIECEKRINEAEMMLDVNITWDKYKNKCISFDVFTGTEYELVKENGNWAWVHLRSGVWASPILMQMCEKVREQGLNTMNFESKQEAIDYSHDLGLDGKVHEHENAKIFLGYENDFGEMIPGWLQISLAYMPGENHEQLMSFHQSRCS